MAASQAEYELVLMLDPEAPDERREQIAADARQRIEAGGAIKDDTAWGMRKMAFEISQRTEADYRFFRFEAGGAPLLDELNHNLRIADGVLRYRIFKVDPSIPVVVPPPPTPLSAGRPERGRRDGGPRGRGDGSGRGRSADTEPAAAPAATAEAPAPESESPSAPEAPTAPPPAEGAPEEAPAEDAPAEAPAEEAPAEDAPTSDDE
jgi:small subunit ribosomal protein S6